MTLNIISIIITNNILIGIINSATVVDILVSEPTTFPHCFDFASWLLLFFTIVNRIYTLYLFQTDYVQSHTLRQYEAMHML